MLNTNFITRSESDSNEVHLPLIENSLFNVLYVTVYRLFTKYHFRKHHLPLQSKFPRTRYYLIINFRGAYCSTFSGKWYIGTGNQIR